MTRKPMNAASARAAHERESKPMEQVTVTCDVTIFTDGYQDDADLKRQVQTQIKAGIARLNVRGERD